MKRRGQSPTSRTLQHCEKKLGWIAGVVERRIPRVFITKDLFGCIDVVAIAGSQIVGIQATTGAHHADRRAKALAEPRLRAWLAAGAGFEIWTWSKRGEEGKRKLWTLRREPLELRMLPMAVAGDVRTEAA